MNIHALFILKNTGICHYSRLFDQEFKDLNANLISPFFSAILSFSDQLISRKLEELEMGGLRFVFKSEKEFIFILLADINVSLLFIHTRLAQIVDLFFRVYDYLGDLRDCKEIENEKFDFLIDSIITGKEDLTSNRNFYQKVVEIFKELMIQDEIEGAALLSTKGQIVYSSLPNDVLLNSLKELEIRFMAGALNLPELYYTLEDGKKVFSTIMALNKKQLAFQIVLLFEGPVPLGMADITLQKVIKQIKKLVK